MRVAIIGASDKPERYSYQALNLLLEKGHEVCPVNPRLLEIEGIKVIHNLKNISGPVDTVAMYVNEFVSNKMVDEILALHPRRIIFNPGAENEFLEKRANEADITTVNACILVMLRTDQF